MGKQICFPPPTHTDPPLFLRLRCPLNIFLMWVQIEMRLAKKNIIIALCFHEKHSTQLSSNRDEPMQSNLTSTVKTQHPSLAKERFADLAFNFMDSPNVSLHLQNAINLFLQKQGSSQNLQLCIIGLFLTMQIPPRPLIQDLISYPLTNDQCILIYPVQVDKRLQAIFYQ